MRESQDGRTEKSNYTSSTLPHFPHYILLFFSIHLPEQRSLMKHLQWMSFGYIVLTGCTGNNQLQRSRLCHCIWGDELQSPHEGVTNADTQHPVLTNKMYELCFLLLFLPSFVAQDYLHKMYVVWIILPKHNKHKGSFLFFEIWNLLFQMKVFQTAGSIVSFCG